MAKLSTLSQLRLFKRRSILGWVYQILIVFCCIDNAFCATLPSSLNVNSSDPENPIEGSSRSNQRNLLPPESLLTNGNPYFPVSPQFGVPTYNFHQFTQGFPFQTFDTTSPATTKRKQSTRLTPTKTKVKVPQEELDPVSPKEEDGFPSEKQKNRKNKKDKTKNKKQTEEKQENGVEKVESKTVEDEGSGRGCPACVGGACDPVISPSMNISGIPLIQLLVALAVGAFWAAIFAFILHNFIEYKHEGGGYGGGYDAPAPQYGAPAYGPPQSEYGPPQNEYGAPAYGSQKRVSYKQGYGRNAGVTFNDVSNWVWAAIDKFATQYDNN